MTAHAVPGAANRGLLVPVAVIFGAVGVLAGALLASPVVAALFGAGIIAVSCARMLLSWRFLLGLLIVVILFIPTRRYTLPGNLPFDLELYRVLVAAVALIWLFALLADPRMRLRASGFEKPLLVILLVGVASVIVNGGRVSSLGVGPDVVKRLMFFISFLIVFALLATVVRRLDDAEFFVKLLVGGGAVVAALALVEFNTGYNVFDQLQRFLPFLQSIYVYEEPPRGDIHRAVGSAEHPIALGALLVMLIPLAVYVAFRTRHRIWWLVAGFLALGMFSTVSRTSVLMLVVILVVMMWLRPHQAKRLWPALIPALVAVHFALPGTLGTIRYWVSSPSTVVAEQQRGVGQSGQGRFADLGPAFKEFGRQPILGQGFGTRVTGDPKRLANAQILDNQWLKILLETGLVGVIAWFWLFGRFIRRLGSAAKSNYSREGWLLTAIVASVVAYVVSMATYDAFGFTQVTFVLFILLGLGAAVLLNRSPDDEREAGSGSGDSTAQSFARP